MSGLLPTSIAQDIFDNSGTLFVVTIKDILTLAVSKEPVLHSLQHPLTYEDTVAAVKDGIRTLEGSLVEFGAELVGKVTVSFLMS